MHITTKVPVERIETGRTKGEAILKATQGKMMVTNHLGTHFVEDALSTKGNFLYVYHAEKRRANRRTQVAAHWVVRLYRFNRHEVSELNQLPRHFHFKVVS